MPSRTSRLALTVPHVDGEAASSYLSRIAMINGTNAAQFSADQGIRFADVIDGQSEALGHLARRVGVDPGVLQSSSFRRIDTWKFERNGISLPRHGVKSPVTRVCPACLREDALASALPLQNAMAFRGNWQVPFLRSCTRHNLLLVPLWTDANRLDRYDFAAKLGLHLDQIMTGDLDSAEFEPSDFGHWIEHRLSGQNDGAWLDQFDFYAAATFCELLGRAMVLSFVPKRHATAEGEWQQIAELGYRCARQGEAAIQTVLSEVQQRGGPPNDGPSARFGPLYERLSRDLTGPEFAPFRDIVRRHMIATWPLGEGDSVLGETVATRRLHSVRSASNQSGIGTAKLRKALAAAGLAASERVVSDAWDVFDAGSAQPILAALAAGMGASAINESFNFPRDQLDIMVAAGFVKPIPSGDDTYAAYGPADIQAFIYRLLVGSVAMRQAQHDYCNIPQAARRLLCSAKEIVALLLDGSSKRIGNHADRPGYLGILVDTREIRPFLLRDEAVGMTQQEIVDALGLATAHVRALIVDGLLKATQARNPISRKPQFYVLPEDFET